MGKVRVIGIGDGGRESLGGAALQAVAAATLLAGGERHLAFFAEHGAPRLAVTADLPALVRGLQAELAAGGEPVVLASGDPDFFGIGPYLIRELGAERVEVWPGVSSVALAFARAGLAWQDATVVSAHGRPLHSAVAQALGAAKLAFLTDSSNTPAAIARALLDAGYPDSPAWIGEHLGGAAEQVRALRLAEVAQTHDVAALNVLVVHRQVPAAPIRPSFGQDEAAFAHRRGLVTKAEVRAVSLARLRLGPGDVVWDVGAGCGSVAIEAAGLAPGGRVFAIEKDPEQLALLVANLGRYPGRPVTVVRGAAPAALVHLPDPDAVFIGGSGGGLPSILAAVTGRLRPGGRLVLNAATLETLQATQEYLTGLGWRWEWAQIAVSRGTLLRGKTRLRALNPVFVLAAGRAEEGMVP